MGKLTIHTGDFSSAPKGVEVQGSMTDHPAVLSQIGRAIRAPDGDTERHIFTNNENVFAGIRIAIRSRNITIDDIRLIFHSNGVEKTLELRQDGKITRWPKGFFDQLSLDHRELSSSLNTGDNPESTPSNN